MHSKGPARNTYTNNNWCRTCEMRVPKEVLICPDCHYKVRTKPRGQAYRDKMDAIRVRY